jgi:hypothetical protein
MKEKTKRFDERSLIVIGNAIIMILELGGPDYDLDYVLQELGIDDKKEVKQVKKYFKENYIQ